MASVHFHSQVVLCCFPGTSYGRRHSPQAVGVPFGTPGVPYGTNPAVLHGNYPGFMGISVWRMDCSARSVILRGLILLPVLLPGCVLCAQFTPGRSPVIAPLQQKATEHHSRRARSPGNRRHKSRCDGEWHSSLPVGPPSPWQCETTLGWRRLRPLPGARQAQPVQHARTATPAWRFSKATKMQSRLQHPVSPGSCSIMRRTRQLRFLLSATPGSASRIRCREQPLCRAGGYALCDR